MQNRLKILFDEIDQAVSRLVKLYPAEIRCRKGCADCCHAVFDVSLAEAVALQQAFLELPRKKRRQATLQAEKAMKEWNTLKKEIRKPSDISNTRIRCPLLDSDNSCMLYIWRPVNCRTYGAPLEIQGRSVACGLCRFQEGKRYETIRMELIHQRLHELSLSMDRIIGDRRWPVSAIILDVS